MYSHLALGKWGEEQACLFLARQGYRVIERNYHATVGEIDIVAKLGDDFYFIEVKTRHAGELANDTAVTAAKKFKFLKTIKHYCYHRGIGDTGIIPAGLIVAVDRLNKKVTFRLAVFV